MQPQSRLQVLIEGFIAILVLAACAAGELLLLWHGAPKDVDGVVVGKVLGTLDAATMVILGFYFGSTRTSRAQVEAIASIGQAAANTPINITMPNGKVLSSVASDKPAPAAPVAEEEEPKPDQHSHM